MAPSKKSKPKSILTYLFLGSGILLALVMIVENLYPKLSSVASENVVQPINYPVDFALTSVFNLDSLSFIQGHQENLKDEELLALFVLNPKACAPCLFEVREYMRLLTDNNNVKTFILISTSDSIRAYHLYKVLDLKEEKIAYGLTTDSAVENNVIQSNSMYFVGQNEMVFYRIGVFNNMTTTVSYKLNLIQSMYESYNMVNSMLIDSLSNKI